MSMDTLPQEVKAAEIKVQTALIDTQIQLATDSIMRLDLMIEECVKLREELERYHKEIA